MESRRHQSACAAPGEPRPAPSDPAAGMIDVDRIAVELDHGLVPLCMVPRQFPPLSGRADTSDGAGVIGRINALSRKRHHGEYRESRTR